MKIAQVERLALSLPQTAEAPHFDYRSFRVQGKMFVTVPPGGTHIHVFVGDEDRDWALEIGSGYVEKLWWGKKVVGVRITLAKAKAAVVERLIRAAWTRKAPKALSRGTA
jgi:hypothetical protein